MEEFADKFLFPCHMNACQLQNDTKETRLLKNVVVDRRKLETDI